MNHSLVKRLVLLAVSGMLCVEFLHQSFTAAMPHHRVLFVLGAVFFAFGSGHTFARNSKD